MRNLINFIPFRKIKKLSGTAQADPMEMESISAKISDSDEDDDESISIGYATMIIITLGILGSSCVSSKKLAMEQERSEQFSGQLNECEERYAHVAEQNKVLYRDMLELENQLANEQSRYHLLEQQMEYFKSMNTNLLDRLADLAVVSKTGADNIRKSLEAINDQNKYIKDLTSVMRQKDSLNLALVMQLKRSLADINDEDVTVEVKKGVVYISLSDKMLFKSGSAQINQPAEEVLAKIARVLNDHKKLDILVEGHTDNVPISTSCMTDNWDLSVKRATSVVRHLQTRHNIAPERMTAGGRSEYIPKASNATIEGRAVNRRTEIIILPQLDQFFQLLEPPSTD